MNGKMKRNGVVAKLLFLIKCVYNFLIIVILLFNYYFVLIFCCHSCELAQFCWSINVRSWKSTHKGFNLSLDIIKKKCFNL